MYCLGPEARPRRLLAVAGHELAPDVRGPAPVAPVVEVRRLAAVGQQHPRGARPERGERVEELLVQDAARPPQVVGAAVQEDEVDARAAAGRGHEQRL